MTLPALLTMEELVSFHRVLTQRLRTLEDILQQLPSAEREARWGAATNAAIPDKLTRAREAIAELEHELKARKRRQ
jgi:hypothetical protein